MRVWVTRAQPDAAATAARVAARSFEPLVAPLLAAEPLPDALLDLAGVAALAFTSRRGVSAFAAREPGRGWPVFAVGDATAAAAREAGFGQVLSAGGDVDDLARLIAGRPPAGPVLHPGALEPAGDLAGALRSAGLEVRTAALYRTRTLPPSPEAAGAWPSLQAVLLHSPKAARALAEAALPPGPAAILCLSPAVAAPLLEASDGLAAQVRIAASPDEAALLDLLGQGAPLGAGPAPS